MLGVYFEEKHSYDDLGLIMTQKTISPPKPKINRISVPVSNGSIDLTEALTNSVQYEDREINIVSKFTDDMDLWANKFSSIENYLHGKQMNLIFDDDGSFFYKGRVEVTQTTRERNIGVFEISVIADPFKYNINDMWLWNPFSFENGVITEAVELVVEETATATVSAMVDGTYPTFICDSPMTVTYGFYTYDLKAGTNTVYDIIFDIGENELTFNGNGKVTIDYVGRSL